MDIDSLIEEIGRKKFDYQYRTEVLFRTPVETIKNEDFDNFLSEYLEVRKNVDWWVTQARLKSCRSLPKWEKCDDMLNQVYHRMFAHPILLEAMAIGMIESNFDDALSKADAQASR